MEGLRPSKKSLLGRRKVLGSVFAISWHNVSNVTGRAAANRNSLTQGQPNHEVTGVAHLSTLKGWQMDELPSIYPLLSPAHSSTECSSALKQVRKGSQQWQPLIPSRIAGGDRKKPSLPTCCSPRTKYVGKSNLESAGLFPELMEITTWHAAPFHLLSFCKMHEPVIQGTKHHLCLLRKRAD